MIEIPIPILTLEEKKPFETLVTKLQFLQEILYKKTQSFVKAFITELEVEKISQNLSNWHLLTWKDFEKELKKQKAKFSSHQKLNLLAVFEEEKKTYQALDFEVQKTEQDLDTLFSTLYGF
jgi:2-polyprenyl-3-methyl-5-hydroxy-6-metoxy-1,4-benzoquinol methylase